MLVLHKADLPGAEQVEAQVKSMLTLGTREAPPVLRVSSRSGSGVEELWGIPRSLDYAARTAALRAAGVAVWDVLAQCRRNGPNPVVKTATTDHNPESWFSGRFSLDVVSGVPQHLG